MDLQQQPPSLPSSRGTRPTPGRAPAGTTRRPAGGGLRCRWATVLTTAGALAIGAGEAPAIGAGEAPGADPPARAELTGEVVSVDPPAHRLTLRHGPVRGLLPAGETAFSVGAGDARLAVPGGRVRGKVFPYLDGFRLENLYPVDPEAERRAEAVNREFLRGMLLAGARAQPRGVGDRLPDVALYNQEGQLVRPAALGGRYRVVNFIFTRCAEPTMCPAATQRMVRLQREAAAAGLGGERLHLFSISFDPTYDSPGILNEYARTRGIDTANFDLLSGDERLTAALLKTFGIVSFPEKGTLDHTMATLLVDPDGRIIHRVPGARWSVADFLDKMGGRGRESEKER